MKPMQKRIAEHVENNSPTRTDSIPVSVKGQKTLKFDIWSFTLENKKGEEIEVYASICQNADEGDFDKAEVRLFPDIYETGSLGKTIEKAAEKNMTRHGYTVELM